MVVSIVFACLALFSIGSMLAKRPWTLVPARRRTSPTVWDTPLFLETNMVITGGWALLFGAAAVLASVVPGWVNIIVGVGLAGLGSISHRVGSWYSSRRLKEMGLSDPPDAGS